jgi:hypothetical protein
MNQLYYQPIDTVRVSVTRHALLPEASARKPRKRYSLIRILGRALACVVVAAIANVALINFMFFPECNRITRDCFLVQQLWGAK